MKRAATIFGIAGLCLVFSGSAFAQGTGGTLTGTVEDISKALIPGVTIIATNSNTGVTSTVISNESGAYTIPALLPGTYQLRASLPGFQTHTINNIELGSETRRINITLQVTGLQTDVEIKVDASVLPTSSATVGEVMTSTRVTGLPLVSGDVLDLVRIMPGVRLGAFGQETFAGMSSNTINTVRDGLSVSDGRYLNGIFASSTINPDLVGEIRLILTPVDAEMGRGNGQVQITTRSGTNRFSGAAVWNIRNTSLNANTWDNNNDIVTENGVSRWQPTQPDWTNENQITLSFGGPIIRNKTFFFALYDRNIHNQRTLQTGVVMTDTARQGIFRYWEGWNNGNASQAIPSATGTTIASVDFGGNPMRPFRAPGAAGGDYTGNLRCVSVFGRTKADGSPFTDTDCPGGIATYPGGTATAWDTLRPVIDPTGFIRKFMQTMPQANYFGAGDGLNTAGIRWLRGSNANGSSLGNTASLQTGQNINADRSQINIKIDHNFSANHKANVGFTWERSGGDDFLTNWPEGLPGETQRRPKILTSNFTSTLSSTLLNEARFGIRITKTESNAAWQHSNEEIQTKAQEFFLYGGPSLFNGGDPTPMPALFIPGAGIFQFPAATGANAGAAPFNTNAAYLGNFNPLYNFADTLRWTKGVHSFRLGGELRITRSNGYNFLPYNLPRLNGGNGTVVASGLSATGANAIPGLIAGNTGTEASLRNLLYFMAASVGTTTQNASGSVGYWIDSPDDVANGHWEDYLTKQKKYRDQRANEWAAFFQDDWKISRNLTLNLGLRYEYYGAPYLKGGFTSTAIDYGDGLFGAGRGNGDPFNTWLTPGNIFLTGYGGVPAGQTATSLLQCTSGLQQSLVLPVSSCDASKMTTLQFVGPDSPNPGKTVAPVDRNNFGPIVGFSWQLPWFGEGKTTVRGGYQVTYGGSGRNGIDLDAILGGAPGATNTAQLNAVGFNEYLDLTDIQKLVPIVPTLAPGGTFPIYQRGGDFTAYAPDWVTPYTQNFNLSVTRTLSRHFTLDVRYVATRGMKLSGEQNLNAVNVFNNPELFDSLERVRRGEEVELFDQMFAGLNLNANTTGIGATGSYAAVGTTNTAGILQTGSMHLRRWMNDELATGDYVTIAQMLNGNGPGTSGLTQMPTGVSVGGGLLRNGCDQLARGTSIGGAPAGQVMTANGLRPIRCFAENYIVANPQFNDGDGFNGQPGYINNTGSSNYHSLQTQLVMRPFAGVSFTGTYTWSKTLSLDDEDYTDPRDRRSDYTLSGSHRTHDFRANGTFELPMGPNKLFFGGTSGWVARALERWQASFILNLNTGDPETAEGRTSLWDGNQVDVVGPFPVRGGNVEWGVPVGNQGQLGGTYFGNPSAFAKVVDPQCAPGGLTDHTDAMGYNLRGNIGTNGTFTALCDLSAVANAGTGQILLQNALPGKRGTLGQNTIENRGVWSLDGSIAKAFQISESKSIQIRMDATNILNHPTPPTPEFDINDDTGFGIIDGDKTGSRSFRGSVRINF